jgi:hypothetical protein
VMRSSGKSAGSVEDRVAQGVAPGRTR